MHSSNRSPRPRRQTKAKMAASEKKGRHWNGAKSHIINDINEAIYPDLSGFEFNFGDIAWVRTGSHSWWPAQVVDEKSIGPSSKPRKKAESEVLIRIYGAYNYLYINPVKNNGEFKNALKQKNNTIREMLEKTLEADLSRIKSHHNTKGNLPASREHVTARFSVGGEMEDKITRNEETSSVVCVGPFSVKDKERGTICTEEREKAKDVDSKIKIRYIRKQQLRQGDRGGTFGDMKPEKDDRSGINCLKDMDQASHINPGDKKLNKNYDKKQPVSGKSKGGTLENLHQGEEKKQRVNDKTGNESRKHQGRKLKTKQQARMKLVQDGLKEQKVKKKATHVASNQGVEKKRKLTESTRHEVLKCNSEIQDCGRKSEQQDIAKHDKVDVRRYVKDAQVVKTYDASARRMKVMQSLALIAPSGSPFGKNGHVKAAYCKSC